MSKVSAELGVQFSTSLSHLSPWGQVKEVSIQKDWQRMGPGALTGKSCYSVRKEEAPLHVHGHILPGDL